jgi:hypothetical protein
MELRPRIRAKRRRNEHEEHDELSAIFPATLVTLIAEYSACFTGCISWCHKKSFGDRLFVVAFADRVFTADWLGTVEKWTSSGQRTRVQTGRAKVRSLQGTSDGKLIVLRADGVLTCFDGSDQRSIRLPFQPARWQPQFADTVRGYAVVLHLDYSVWAWDVTTNDVHCLIPTATYPGFPGFRTWVSWIAEDFCIRARGRDLDAVHFPTLATSQVAAPPYPGHGQRMVGILNGHVQTTDGHSHCYWPAVFPCFEKQVPVPRSSLHLFQRQRQEQDRRSKIQRVDDLNVVCITPCDIGWWH